jgi:hypothetical protein
VLNANGEVARVYLRPDTNTVADECLTLAERYRDVLSGQYRRS